MSKVVELLGDIVLSHTADDVSVGSMCGEGKVIGLYFTAQWCSPCRAFTPKLIEFYRTFKTRHPDKGFDFEIVFISSDKSPEEFKEYHDEMPWLALPYEDRERKVGPILRSSAMAMPPPTDLTPCRLSACGLSVW
jgi:nucleoredoxin